MTASGFDTPLTRRVAPDMVIALVEDAAAIGLAALALSRARVAKDK